MNSSDPQITPVATKRHKTRKDNLSQSPLRSQRSGRDSGQTLKTVLSFGF